MSQVREGDSSDERRGFQIDRFLHHRFFLLFLGKSCGFVGNIIKIIVELFILLDSLFTLNVFEHHLHDIA